MTEHRLKVWPEYFRALELDQKTFEVRRDDRVPKYAVGDTLVLCEWNPTGEAFTSRELRRTVTYKAVPSDHVPLPQGWCVLGLAVAHDAPGTVPRALVDDVVSTGPDGRRAVYLAQAFGVFRGEDLVCMFAEDPWAQRFRKSMVDADKEAIGFGQAPSEFEPWTVRPVRVSRASWGTL